MKYVFDSYKLNTEIVGKRVFFNGILVSETEIYVDRYVEPSEVEIREGVGQFSIVKTYCVNNEKYIEVFTDFMGFYEVFYFYCEESKRLIISNSFRSLVDYYRKEIGILNIDTNYAVPLLLSNYNFFNLPFSSRTTALQIKRIPANKNIFFSEKDGLNFLDKFFEENENENESESNYEYLLDKGIRSVRKKIQMIDKLKVNKILYMSGGKDSRVTLASLTYALSNKGFKVFSQNPKKFSGSSRENIEQDLVITNKLCLLLSLEKITEISKKLEYKTYNLDKVLSFEEAYHQWMNDFSNIKYRCNFFSYERLNNKDISLIEYHGLAGEVYRNYWSSYFQRFTSFDKKLEKNNKGVKRDLQKFFLTFVKTKIADVDLYENAKRSLIKEFSNIAGGNIYEKLDNHYGEFRNKYHFGVMLSKLKSGILVFSPLIDYNYLLASKNQGIEDKKDGKLLYDLIDKTNPYLNLMPFDSSVWDSRLKSRFISTKNPINLPDFNGMSSLNPISLYSDKEGKANENKDVKINFIFNYKECAKEKVINYINFLAINDDSSHLFNEDVKIFLLSHIDKNDVALSTVLGKIGSIIDLYQESCIVYEINPN